jgi:uncharacterized protein YjlB
MNVVAHRLGRPQWPLLVYPSVLRAPTPEEFEALFAKNQWPAAWRDGVFPFHHFHSNAHEALGVYSGEVTVQFGGEQGITVTARAGDVVVLPAGTAHKKLAARGALGIVGAYPEASHPDMHRGTPAEDFWAALPACDPVQGPGGPLFTYWVPRSGR